MTTGGSFTKSGEEFSPLGTEGGVGLGMEKAEKCCEVILTDVGCTRPSEVGELFKTSCLMMFCIMYLVL